MPPNAAHESDRQAQELIFAKKHAHKEHHPERSKPARFPDVQHDDEPEPYVMGTAHLNLSTGIVEKSQRSAEFTLLEHDPRSGNRFCDKIMLHQGDKA